MITRYTKGKAIGVMVWACIWWQDGRVHKSDLVTMERDSGKKARVYCSIIPDSTRKPDPQLLEPGFFSCKIMPQFIQLEL